MKKLALVLAVVMVLSLGLTACGGSTSSTGTASSAPAGSSSSGSASDAAPAAGQSSGRQHAAGHADGPHAVFPGADRVPRVCSRSAGDC